MAKYSSSVLEMARKGAEHTYDELQSQIARLVRDFPHLAKRTGRSVSRAYAHGVAAVEASAPKVRRRARQMSAAARKAVSIRMKKYWAERRKTKKGK